MTVTATLGTLPKWPLINNQGTLAGGGKLYTYRSLNKIEEKPVYQNSARTLMWENPIRFGLNGTQGPFYWAVDDAALTDTYYLVATDSDDNVLWTMDNYSPAGGGGGGGGTTYIPIKNYIANNQFIDHIDAVNPIASTNIIIAPSNHKGFTPAVSNPLVGTYGALGPDIRFVKNNTAAVDAITFPLFDLSTAPLNGDVTPVDYVRYQCTNSPTGELYKCFQFPITQKVKNLSNQVMSFNIWAKSETTPVTVNLYVRQYFGSGTASSGDVRSVGFPIELSTSWALHPVSITIPSVAGGKTLGTINKQTNDDAVYLQLEMPLNVTCDISFIKPALYLGDLNPNLDFEDYDQIDSITQTSRTGDVKIGYQTVAPLGWLLMNDGSIGNVGSPATLRANMDTFQLYSTIYTSVIDSWAPVSGGRTAPGNTMANAITDFLADKTLTLSKTLGRTLAVSGTGAGLTARALGESLGEETHTLSIAEMPSHTHPAPPGLDIVFNGIGGQGLVGGGNESHNGTNLQNTGGGLPHNTMQPTTFTNVFIKL